MPAAVRCVPGVRSNSAVPSTRSSWAVVWLTAGWPRCSLRAAACNDPDDTTTSNTRPPRRRLRRGVGPSGRCPAVPDAGARAVRRGRRRAAGTVGPVVTLDPRPGDLQIFRGRYSAHTCGASVPDRDHGTPRFAHTEDDGVIGRRSARGSRPVGRWSARRSRGVTGPPRRAHGLTLARRSRTVHNACGIPAADEGPRGG